MSFCTLPWLVWPVSKQPDVYTVPYIQSHLSPCEIVLNLFPTPYASLLPPHGKKSISASHKSFWFGVSFRDSVIYSEGWVWKCFWGTEKESCWELHCQGKAFIGTVCGVKQTILWVMWSIHLPPLSILPSVNSYLVLRSLGLCVIGF